MYRRLRDLREDLDISQSEIADFLHCTQSAYSKIERGDREIPVSFFVEHYGDNNSCTTRRTLLLRL